MFASLRVFSEGGVCFSESVNLRIRCILGDIRLWVGPSRLSSLSCDLPENLTAKPTLSLSSTLTPNPQILNHDTLQGEHYNTNDDVSLTYSASASWARAPPPLPRTFPVPRAPGAAPPHAPGRLRRNAPPPLNRKPETINPKPETRNPKPETRNPTPCTLHPTPYTLHPTPYALHPTPYTLHPTPYALRPTPCALLPTPYTLHPTPYTLHPTPYTLHPKPKTQNPKPETPRPEPLSVDKQQWPMRIIPLLG
ncbi:hypothetical protein T484DRAFT_1611817 [Baffinella frigidus]|nr:hypothetical protein T484DRAFT_1611817 [Cryptophyta sp. CCMP2293]